MRKEVWFGLSIMAAVVIAVFWLLPAPSDMTNGHLGLLMLALIVIAIMLGFPTAFTLMGMGVMFAWLAYRSANPDLAVQQTLDLMVQRAYSVMSNDVLISIPLFVFMGYLVERANLIEKLFRSLHLALARIPGSLAVATLVTCAVFATATGIVGAVVTLMGLLALPAMLRAGYNVKISAGVITAGGCLGILIPPSVMLIVYGATAGVSVVKLYAGAFFPGIMLAGLYIAYVMIVAKLKPALMPPLAESDRRVDLPAHLAAISAGVSRHVLPGLIGALKGRANAGVPAARLLRELLVALLPAIVFAVLMGLTWHSLTKPDFVADTSQLEKMGDAATGLAEPTEPAVLPSRRRIRASRSRLPKAQRNHLPKRRRCRSPSAAQGRAAGGEDGSRRVGAGPGPDGVLDHPRRRAPRSSSCSTRSSRSCASRSSRCCWRRSSRWP